MYGSETSRGQSPEFLKRRYVVIDVSAFLTEALGRLFRELVVVESTAPISKLGKARRIDDKGTGYNDCRFGCFDSCDDIQPLREDCEWRLQSSLEEVSSKPRTSRRHSMESNPRGS